MYVPEQLTIGWIKQAYAKQVLTPKELIEEMIKRAKTQEEKNIWIVPPTEEAIQPYLDALPKEREQYPLWGIPFAIKDNIDLAGVPTTAACPDFSYIPKENATVVEKLIKAGAIPIGKTNLDQFATGLVGTRSPYGEVHNAYQPEMISGGSSSGSAVSVALGLAAFALGTDTAGSGRVPAMLNTLVGWKPPVGSWSSKGVVPACASLDCVTVFAKKMEDVELVNSIAKGFDAECCWSKTFQEKGKTLPKKVYIPKEEPEFYGDFKEIYRQKWNACIKRIKGLGILVEELDMNMFQKAALILYEGAYVAERWEDLKEFVEANPGKTFPVTETILRSGEKKENTAAKLFGDLHQLQQYKAKARLLLEDSVMIMPTAGGSFTREQVRRDPIETNSKMGLYTNHCNLLDLTAIAVPENSSDRTYPFGITIFGRSDSENLVLAFGEAFLASESIQLAVCGLHKKGYPLEYQLTELGAEWLGTAKTAKGYHLYELDTEPKKPGMVYQGDGETSIEVELYDIPKQKLGYFMELVKKPLYLGDIELEDKRTVKGFLCEAAAIVGAREIIYK